MYDKKNVTLILILQMKDSLNIFPDNERKPSESYSLSNCTWFRERSCCTRTEVTSIFQEMPPLDTSNEECRSHLNYMMCFVCSPTQYKWFKDGKLNICKEFCDDIYTQCEEATYGGKTIGSVYSSGSEFCKAQFFHVVENKKDVDCFEYDSTLFASAISCHCTFLFVLPLVISLTNNYFWWT